MNTWQVFCVILLLNLNALCLAVPPLSLPASSSPVLPPSSSLQLLNISLVFNNTNLRTVSGFPDPWDFRMPGSPLTVEFYGYSDPVSITKFEKCIRQAEDNIAIQILADHASNPLGTRMFRYYESTVDLFLVPSERMTWHMWARVPSVIEYYLQRNGWKGAQFIILWEGLGDVGYGSVTDAIVASGG